MKRIRDKRSPFSLSFRLPNSRSDSRGCAMNGRTERSGDRDIYGQEGNSGGGRTERGLDIIMFNTGNAHVQLKRHHVSRTSYKYDRYLFDSVHSEML